MSGSATARQKKPPQSEGGFPEDPRSAYWHVVNKCLPNLWKGRLSGEKQLEAILLLLSETLGKPGKPESTWKTIPQIATKVGCEARIAYAFIADAVQRGLLTATDRRDPSGTAHPKAKCYTLTPQNWATAPLYEAKLRKVVPISEPFDEPLDEAEDNSER
jgi:hypothetical protein